MLNQILLNSKDDFEYDLSTIGISENWFLCFQDDDIFFYNESNYVSIYNNINEILNKEFIILYDENKIVLSCSKEQSDIIKELIKENLI